MAHRVEPGLHRHVPLLRRRSAAPTRLAALPPRAGRGGVRARRRSARGRRRAAARAARAGRRAVRARCGWTPRRPRPALGRPAGVRRSRRRRSRDLRAERASSASGDVTVASTPLTVAQALVRFLAAQHGRARRRARAASSPAASASSATATSPASARRSSSTPDFCATTWRATSRRWCTPPRPTQDAATGCARSPARRSIGPGATNMITGAARRDRSTALPVLLLPGDIFARRNVAPGAAAARVRAQSQDVSVNDCFKPVSRYWDRINRPEQLITALPEAMRVLTSPAETGAVTLALPQDVQAEAFDYPAALFEPRVWTIRAAARRSRRACTTRRALIRAQRATADRRRRRRDLQRGDRRAARASSTRPASRSARRRRARARCRSDHPLALGAIGATGTRPPTASRATPTS